MADHEHAWSLPPSVQTLGKNVAVWICRHCQKRVEVTPTRSAGGDG